MVKPPRVLLPSIHVCFFCLYMHVCMYVHPCMQVHLIIRLWIFYDCNAVYSFYICVCMYICTGQQATRVTVCRILCISTCIHTYIDKYHHTAIVQIFMSRKAFFLSLCKEIIHILCVHTYTYKLSLSLSLSM